MTNQEVTMAPPRISDREKFESKFIPEPNSGCWLWIGAGWPYGLLKHKGIRWIAPRFSWTIYRGPIPDGMYILHRCDTPPCVNPDHLFIGTAKDNMIDRSQKGRTNCQKGIDHHQAILTEDDVRAIRLDCRPQSRIAKHYMVGQMTISDIKRRVTWRHVT